MSTITLFEGDNRDHLRRLIDEGVRVHSVVTDPPYGLTSITKRFGGKNAAPAKFGSDGAFSRASAGFMGSKWDGTGIERDPEFWRLIWEILLPGGYVVAFSGSRTGHWQACAMEMAGFIMHPFLGWCYGSGFPKAHNAAMAIDKQLGVEGGFIAEGGPVKRLIPGAQQHATGDWTKTDDRAYQPGRRVPGSPEAAAWEGWAYGGQALKPALEPIYVGQKPFSEKNGALNLLKHGVGAINIDGCRVAGEPWKSHVATGLASEKFFSRGEAKEILKEPHELGRHPANLLHDGSPEVVAIFPESKGQQGDVRGTEKSHTGSAARFFNSFPLDTDPIRYQAKATKADRAGSKHPTVKPVKLMEWLVTLVTPSGGTVLDPFAGSGTTGQAARNLGFDCILMEGEAKFAADIRNRFPTAIEPCSNGTHGEQADSFDDLLCDEFDELMG